MVCERDAIACNAQPWPYMGLGDAVGEGEGDGVGETEGDGVGDGVRSGVGTENVSSAAANPGAVSGSGPPM